MTKKSPAYFGGLWKGTVIDMKSFCIVGLNVFGETLARTLAAEGRQVLVIDRDASLVTPLADLVTNAVIGEPSSESVLRAAGVQDYECAIVCESENINDNVLESIILKELGVKYVVARAVNEGHRKVLNRVGVDLVVFPEQDMGERLGFTLSRDKVTDYMEFHGYKLVELKVPQSWYGKDLIQLGIRPKYGVTVVAVTRPDNAPGGSGQVDVSPAPSRKFAKGERMTLIGSDTSIDRCIKVLGND